MLRHVVIAMGVLAASTASARAADPTPIRTLIYSVTITETTRNEEHTSGFRDGGRGATPIGSARVDRQSSVADEGTLTVKVIAATGDGGLAVDASYAGKNSNQPVVRIAIFPDGRLTYNPSAEVSIATLRVLPLLARGLTAERNVSPGSVWSTSVPVPASGTIAYRVDHVDGEKATLAIQSHAVMPGPRGYIEDGVATALYATDRLCPISYQLDALAHHQPDVDQYVTVNDRIRAELVSDTFDKKS